MTATQGPRQSTPDSAARKVKSGKLARLGTYVRASLAARSLYAKALPANASLDDEFETVRWLVGYAECFESAVLALRAEILREMKEEAGGWRKLEARLGVKESTLRGWAAPVSGS